ncbi:MAG TPA: phosphopantothenate/pantothenate synthetase [Candidatus Nitrosotalea sp.]|nr:phosphopantothenate/pantothenate synthetase [Candidatus Nitrosotalea sp.]
MKIPKSHPRAESLKTREKLVSGYRSGLVVEEGLLAHGRGEMFDYLIGEKTLKTSHNALRAAAQMLMTAKHPVISVNGNLAALCPREVVQLAKVTGAEIEINLFYASQKRKEAISRTLKRNGATKVLGLEREFSQRIPKLDSARRVVDERGIFIADVVLVPLEDGDRTTALKKFGKKVITFDLNPMSRTAQAADVTIVDNITRGMGLLTDICRRMKGSQFNKTFSFDNKKNLNQSILLIKNNLRRLADA